MLTTLSYDQASVNLRKDKLLTQDHNIAKNHLEEKTIEIQEVVILEAINLADH